MEWRSRPGYDQDEEDLLCPADSLHPGNPLSTYGHPSKAGGEAGPGRRDNRQRDPGSPHLDPSVEYRVMALGKAQSCLRFCWNMMWHDVLSSRPNLVVWGYTKCRTQCLSWQYYWSNPYIIYCGLSDEPLVVGLTGSLHGQWIMAWSVTNRRRKTSRF